MFHQKHVRSDSEYMLDKLAQCAGLQVKFPQVAMACPVSTIIFIFKERPKGQQSTYREKS